MTSPPDRAIARWIAFAVLCVAGAIFTAGGSMLVSLHGSPYYLLSGLTLLGCGALLIRRPKASRRLYTLLLGATVAWALWEVGSDPWALAPRILTPVAFGAVFLMWGRADVRSCMRILCLLLLATVVGAASHYAFNQRPADPILRAGLTRLPPLAQRVAPPLGASSDWPHVGNDLGASRHSELSDITPENVSRLQLAWTYHTGETEVPLEATPIKVGESLYLCTGSNDVIALDAETGRLRWRFESGAFRSRAIQKVCRGVAYFHSSDDAVCGDRIITNTVDARLIALDAATGSLCEGFGVHGQVSLLTGMGDWQGRIVPGYYSVTSAPTVVGGRVVVGGWVSDAQYWGEPSGVIRAFDAQTGRFVWAFDLGRPGRHTEPPPGGHYTPSTPNAWAPMSADEELGLVYAPTGNTSGSDYYGVRRRPFDERYSSSIIAIDVRDGSVRWTFQTVHHDLWDYDVAAQPVLTEITAPAGQVRPALIQATKTGEIFVLDRRDGTPIYRIGEVPVPSATTVPGERIAATQPASIHMPSVGGPELEERDMWGLTPIDQMLCRIRFRQARYEGAFTPPGVRPFIQYPGIFGGVEWSSVSVDPLRGILFVNATRIANYDRLIPRAEADAQGRRPEGFGGHYMQRAQSGTPYAVSNPPFLSPLSIPCQNPPFGTISAIDLSSGRLLWTRWLGTARASGPLGVASYLPLPIGTPNLGGSLATRSGLTFIAAGQDRRFRAFRSGDGRLLWEQPLPAVSIATPMTYRSTHSGRQFVVATAGNADPRLGRQGDAVVAYALPR